MDGLPTIRKSKNSSTTTQNPSLPRLGSPINDLCPGADFAKGIVLLAKPALVNRNAVTCHSAARKTLPSRRRGGRDHGNTQCRKNPRPFTTSPLGL